MLFQRCRGRTSRTVNVKALYAEDGTSTVIVAWSTVAWQQMHAVNPSGQAITTDKGSQPNAERRNQNKDDLPEEQVVVEDPSGSDIAEKPQERS